MAMLFMAITGIAAYWSTEHLRDTDYWVRHTFQVIGEAQNIRANLIEFESACRGYLVTGDEKYLEPNPVSRAHLTESRNLIRWLTVDNPAQQRRLAAMDLLIDRRLDELVNLTNTRKQKGLALAVAEGLQNNNREHTAEIQNLLAMVENEEHD